VLLYPRGAPVRLGWRLLMLRPARHRNPSSYIASSNSVSGRGGIQVAGVVTWIGIKGIELLVVKFFPYLVPFSSLADTRKVCAEWIKDVDSVRWSSSTAARFITECTPKVIDCRLQFRGKRTITLRWRQQILGTSPPHYTMPLQRTHIFS
jgi:hypothetical protein